MTTGSFDSVAWLYDPLARLVFGHSLHRAQRLHLNQVPPGASVLILGGGTGRLLDEVLRQCRPRQVVYLEASAQMLNRASKRMLRQRLVGNVVFRVGTETDLRPTDRFDVIMTPFVLDLFTDETLRNTMLPRLRHALKPGGLWLVTDFVQTPIWWQRALLWLMIRFFRMTANIEIRRLADWQSAMAAAGLQLQERSPALRGMVSSEVWRRL